MDKGIHAATGVIMNHGSIEIMDSNALSSTRGVLMSISSTFQNLNPGSLDITGFGLYPNTRGIRNEGQFTNTGNISIEEITEAGNDNVKGFMNNGTIVIHSLIGNGVSNKTLGVFENQVLEKFR